MSTFDPTVAAEIVTAITDSYPEPAMFSFLALRRGDRPDELVIQLPTNLDRALEWLSRRADHDLYTCGTPLQADERGGYRRHREGMAPSRNILIDIDGVTAAKLECNRELLARCPGSSAVNSGHGIQDRIPVADALDADQYHRLALGLIEHLGADASKVNPEDLGRAGGTNYKPPIADVSILVSATSGDRITSAELAAMLPVVTPKRRRQGGSPGTTAMDAGADLEPCSGRSPQYVGIARQDICAELAALTDGQERRRTLTARAGRLGVLARDRYCLRTSARHLFEACVANQLVADTSESEVLDTIRRQLRWGVGRQVAERTDVEVAP